MDKLSNLDWGTVTYLLYLQNKIMEHGDFWNAYESINFLLYGTLFNSYS